MSDEAIKKALVCCLVDDCMSCPIIRFHDCRTMLKNETISLLNRQQAGIEKLKGAVQEWVDGKCLSQKHLLMIGNLQNEIEQAKTEAIKEFAEKVKNYVKTHCNPYGKPIFDYDTSLKILKYLDNLLAEMAGEQNA